MKILSSLLIPLFSAALATPVAGQLFPGFDASQWFYDDPRPDTETYWKDHQNGHTGIDIVLFDQHLQRFTKEDTLTVSSFYQRFPGSVLYNFRSPDGSPEIATNPDNSFYYPITWNGCFYFTVRSKKEPGCEMVISYLSRSVPPETKTYWRCAN